MYDIIAKMKDEKEWSSLVMTGEDITYGTYEEALFEIECMKEMDEDCGEEWEYRIVEL